MKTKFILKFICLSTLLLNISCSKSWLDEKPAKSLVVPETIKDLQAILDDEYRVNSGYSVFGIISSDLVYIADNDMAEFADEDRAMYRWNSEINYVDGYNREWVFYFQLIRSANLVLDGAAKLTQDTETKNLIGQAHFFRALGYYYLAQTFCKPYVKADANSDLGLPIRLASDVNKLEKRSTLQQVYDLVIADLKLASANMQYVPKYITRPSKTAAMALLSKTYLMMQDHSLAKQYADSVLKVKPGLLDFNNEQVVSANLPFCFKAMGAGNPEIIFYAKGSNSTYAELCFQGTPFQVKEEFYNSYSDNDKRKEFYFFKDTERINFVGTYSGDRSIFQGLSTNEMHYISAECDARLNNLSSSRKTLNDLLKNRYKTGTTPTITENDPLALLKIVLQEKTKEFPRVSNIWWEDLRRLNLDPKFQRTLTRVIAGKLYILPPNDPRYVFPIPINEIKFSGLEQNIR